MVRELKMDERSRTSEELRQAQQIAESMVPHESPELLERRKDQAVQAFFAESGIPSDLKEGWAIYQQRRKMREGVGAPLPPGGCLLLGREATVAGVMAEAHMKLSAALRIDSKAIKMRLKRNEDGHVNLVADVDPPSNWIIPVAVDRQTQTPQEAAKLYIQRSLMQINTWFRSVVGERLVACEIVRPELQQRVAPWGGDDAPRE
jgi:hypothetical protein